MWPFSAARNIVPNGVMSWARLLRHAGPLMSFQEIRNQRDGQSEHLGNKKADMGSPVPSVVELANAFAPPISTDILLLLSPLCVPLVLAEPDLARRLTALAVSKASA